MTSRYPPQNRMPALVPQRTEALWYPKKTGIEHMSDELDREEAAYESRDLEEQEEEEEGEEDEEDEAVTLEGDNDRDQEHDQDHDHDHDHDPTQGNINQGYYMSHVHAPYSPTQGSYDGHEEELEEELEQNEGYGRDLDEDIEEATSYHGSDNDDSPALYSSPIRRSP
ncbi:hypothetical protein BGZ54_004407 [Gamsiella multidivaricata]|nr:hypothetical protein BGZ54_004407 [Gamsiella multidivaricata]